MKRKEHPTMDKILPIFIIGLTIIGIFLSMMQKRWNTWSREKHKRTTIPPPPPIPTATGPRELMQTLEMTNPPPEFDPEATEHGVPRLRMMSLLLTDGRDSKEQTRSVQQLGALRDRIGDTAAQVSQNSEGATFSPPRMDTLWDFLKVREMKANEVSWWILTIRWTRDKSDSEVILPIGPGLSALDSYKAKSEFPCQDPQKMILAPTFVLLHVTPVNLHNDGKAVDPKHRSLAQEQRQARDLQKVRPFYPSFPDEMLETLF